MARITNNAVRRVAIAGTLVLATAALLGAACGGGTSNADKTSTAIAKGGAATAAPTTAATKAAPTAGSTGTAASGAGTGAILERDTSIGKVLTDSAGKTLYTFKNDTPSSGTSACSGGCATLWPPLTTTGTPSKPADATGDAATITRSDGSKQVTYKGSPLYTFMQDAAPGDTKGDGFANGLWSAAKP